VTAVVEPAADRVESLSDRSLHLRRRDAELWLDQQFRDQRGYLVVPPAEVVDAVGGWVSAERGVGPVEVVAV